MFQNDFEAALEDTDLRSDGDWLLPSLLSSSCAVTICGSVPPPVLQACPSLLLLLMLFCCIFLAFSSSSVVFMPLLYTLVLYGLDEYGLSLICGRPELAPVTCTPPVMIAKIIKLLAR